RTDLPAQPEHPMHDARGRAETGTRLDDDVDGDLAAIAPHVAQKLVVGHESLLGLRGDRHQIEDDERAARGLEASLEHVRLVGIATRHASVADRRDAPAAAVRIEERAENRWAVETRPAQPVDRAGARYECRRTTIADQGVVVDPHPRLRASNTAPTM